MSGKQLQRRGTHGVSLSLGRIIPPEQYKGEPAGPRSDQFSFCVALYEALYGVLPFEGETFEALAVNVLTGRTRPQPTGTPVPRPLHAAIMRGMAVDPEQRFPSMKELLAALSFDSALNPAALPVLRRVFSGVLIALSVVLVSIFLGPILRKQNTVHQAMISALILFFGVGSATLFLRKMLLRNTFHRGIVFLILSLTGQEALISSVAFLSGMTVAQTVAMELAALVALSGSLTYFFFRRGWLIMPVVLLAMGYVVYSPQDAGLIAILVHVGCAGAAIWLWGRSAGAPGSQAADLPGRPLS